MIGGNANCNGLRSDTITSRWCFPVRVAIVCVGVGGGKNKNVSLAVIELLLVAREIGFSHIRNFVVLHKIRNDCFRHENSLFCCIFRICLGLVDVCTNSGSWLT